jgi:hypothetical protein
MNAKNRTIAVLILCVAGVCETRAAADEVGLKAKVEKVFELGSSARTRDQAQSQYQQLRSDVPQDARIPYAYAVMLIKQHRDREAVGPLNEAFQLGRRDLSLWKTRIWFSVQAGRYVEALDDMVALCERMPANTASAEVEAKCSETAGYLGQLCGYLAGPGRLNRNQPDVGFLEYRLDRITSLLGKPRGKCFERGRQSVLGQYSTRATEIEALASTASDAEDRRRERRLGHLDEDERYAFGELEKMEEIRGDVRAGATSERNTIAAGAAHRYDAADRYDAAFRYGAAQRLRGSYDRKPVTASPTNPGTAKCNPPPKGQTQGRLAADAVEKAHGKARAEGTEQANGAAEAGYYRQTGLGDSHYLDVNRREENEFHRLGLREKNMNRRLLRIAKDEANLLGQPIIGNTYQVSSLRVKAVALVTYVRMPLCPEDEQGRILASFNPSHPGGQAQPASQLAAR